MQSSRFVLAVCSGILLFGAAALVEGIPASAANPPAQPAPVASAAVKLPIKEFTLQNGLRVYLSATTALQRTRSASSTMSARATSAPAAPASRTSSST